MANGKRTGGPKTAAGKLVASKNAFKSGAYSSIAVLPHESQEEFDALVEQFIIDFSPTDIAQTILVKELATLAWKKIRYEKYERAVYLTKFNEKIDYGDFVKHNYSYNFIAQHLVGDIPKMDAAFLQRETKNYQFLKSFVEKELTEDDLRGFEKVDPEVYAELVEIIKNNDYLKGEPITHQNILAITVKDLKEEEINFIHYALNAYLRKMEALVWLEPRLEEVKEVILRIKEARLLKLMENPTPRRAYEDLSRLFARALSELRKQQSWRRSITVIDLPAFS